MINEDFNEFITDSDSIFECPKCRSRIDLLDHNCDGEIYEEGSPYVFSCEECGLSFESWCSKSYSFDISLRKPSLEKDISRKEKELEKIKNNPDKDQERQNWLVSRLDNEIKFLKNELSETI